jgi:hypothetical protein
MVATGGSSTDRVRRVAKASALLGAAAWLALLWTAPHDAVTRWNVERWVQLAVLVYVPAVLWFVGGDVSGEDTADADATGADAGGADVTAADASDGWIGRTYRVGVWLQPVGAACVVASAFVSSVPASGALAAAWVVVTGVLATFALLRLRAHGVTPLSALLVDAAFAYAVVGAVALVLSRLGITFHFSAAIIHLTAIHYHYAGFVLPVVAGLTGRFVEDTYPDDSLRRGTFRATGAIVLAGMVVIAIGITASPLVEVVSVAFFTVAVAVFAVLSLSLVPRILRDDGGVGGEGTARVVLTSSLLAVASASVVATMAFAVGYGWSAYTGETVVSLATMIAWHGTVNAVGFAAAGLGAWFLLAPDSRARRVDAPFSRLRSRWRVGADYPGRTGVAGECVAGEMDDFDAFARDDFDTTRVAPAVRAFYERTSEYRMGVTADWHRPFRTGAAVAAVVTSAVEQLNLPGPREHGTVRVLENELFAVADDSAGGEGAAWSEDRIEDARFWLRTDVDTDEAVFVAVYGSQGVDSSSGVDDGDRDVNIAVPLPASTLSTVLRMDALALADRDDVGVTLTTRAPGHPGLYLSVPSVDVRLPMHQRFRVWPADATPTDDGPTVDVTRMLDAVHAASTGDAAQEARTTVAADGASTDDVVVATHEMWLWGRQFLTIRYVAVPTAATP